MPLCSAGDSIERLLFSVDWPQFSSVQDGLLFCRDWPQFSSRWVTFLSRLATVQFKMGYFSVETGYCSVQDGLLFYGDWLQFSSRLVTLLCKLATVQFSSRWVTFLYVDLPLFSSVQDGLLFSVDWPQFSFFQDGSHFFIDCPQFSSRWVTFLYILDRTQLRSDRLLFCLESVQFCSVKDGGCALGKALLSEVSQALPLKQYNEW